jgi:hypothetical protein
MSAVVGQFEKVEIAPSRRCMNQGNSGRYERRTGRNACATLKLAHYHIRGKADKRGGAIVGWKSASRSSPVFRDAPGRTG